MGRGLTDMLVATGLRKSYPGVHAVRGVDLTVRSGSVHAIVGENGAGKSTLVKMITGAVLADSGTVELDGRLIRATTPAAALRAGIAAVHQEPNVIPALSPVANVFLGQSLRRVGMLRERAMRARLQSWSDELGLEMPLDGPAGALSVGAQQMIEIVRALEHDARVVVMDEPTASLSTKEREALFRTIELLRQRGTGIVFITHKLDDVLRLADEVTVLRDGGRVTTIPVAEASVPRLVHAMLGSDLEEVLATRPRSGPVPDGESPEVLSVRSLRVAGVLDGVDLSVRRGEIVGVAGLVGAGRSTLLGAIAGAGATASGSMCIDGRAVRWPRTPRQARRLGIAFTPEDRRTDGLVLSQSAAANLTLPSLSLLARLGFMRQSTMRIAAAEDGMRVGFDPGRVAAAARTLSGGNQQKLVLGRLLRARPQVLLVDEPTRGIDVGAKGEIFRLLLELAESGMAIVMVSEETEELIAFAHRVVVLRGGALVGEFRAGSDAAGDVLTAMFPVEQPTSNEARGRVA